MEDTIVATNFLPIPDWFSAAVEGVGVAVTDLKGDGSTDLVVLIGDCPGNGVTGGAIN
jgi:hypothetical protein